MLKKGERGGWDDPRAPRARTIRMCSLDGRSRDHPSHPLDEARSLRPRLGQGASRLAGDGWVRTSAFLSILQKNTGTGNLYLKRL